MDTQKIHKFSKCIFFGLKFILMFILPVYNDFFFSFFFYFYFYLFMYFYFCIFVIYYWTWFNSTIWIMLTKIDIYFIHWTTIHWPASNALSSSARALYWYSRTVRSWKTTPPFCFHIKRTHQIHIYSIYWSQFVWAKPLKVCEILLITWKPNSHQVVSILSSNMIWPYMNMKSGPGVQAWSVYFLGRCMKD